MLPDTEDGMQKDEATGAFSSAPITPAEEPSGAFGSAPIETTETAGGAFSSAPITADPALTEAAVQAAAAAEAAAAAAREQLESELRAAEEEQRLLSEAARAAKQAQKAKVHTVVSGDSLWAIAAEYLGDGSRWPEIYEANKGVIGDNPNMIHIGQELTIPSA
jgi:nucleoid-associated protein YgaU